MCACNFIRKSFDVVLKRSPRQELKKRERQTSLEAIKSKYGNIGNEDIDTDLVSKNGRFVRSRKNDGNVEINLEKDNIKFDVNVFAVKSLSMLSF